MPRDVAREAPAESAGAFSRHSGSSVASPQRPGSGGYGATVNSARIPIRPGKHYELRGYVRAAKGHGYVKFDYFQNDRYLGMTSDDYVTRPEWTLLQFASETENYPRATHLIATLVGGDGEFEVWFDEVSITEK